MHLDKTISDGVNIYSLRGDEADFTFLASRHGGIPPYVGNRPF